MTRKKSLEELIEQLGLVIEDEGFPRIASRIYALLLVEDEPFTFDALVDRLQVSRGSVSGGTRMLEREGILERTTRGGDRRDYYRLDSRRHVRLLERHLERRDRWYKAVQDCFESLPAGMPTARRRLEKSLRFQDLLRTGVRTALEAWSDEEE